MTTDSAAKYPHAGTHLLHKRGTFQLGDSDQASTFNTARHAEWLTGPVILAYDSYVVVRVPGWRFAHTVPASKVTPVDADAPKGGTE